MADDFIVEEETSNRTFLYVAGGMAALLLLGLIAIVIISLTRRGGNGNSEIAIMNQTIEAQNRLVTQTVAAMETLAVQAPSTTPSPTLIKREGATATLIPTFTPSPMVEKNTPTPVAQTKSPEVTVIVQESTVESTAVVQEITPTLTPTTITTPAQLPASGLGMWKIVVIGAVLVAVIIAARRLRPVL
ncbi:MAG: hypothetical protein JXA42_01630 [Anaerolineales bacterium]|nr:hypothetical protein [Anaerolineales bacterium]